MRLEKRLEWNEERIRYWLGTGAQPSKPVARLLDRVRIENVLMRAVLTISRLALFLQKSALCTKACFERHWSLQGSIMKIH